jgi:hypothetical protein
MPLLSWGFAIGLGYKKCLQNEKQQQRKPNNQKTFPRKPILKTHVAFLENILFLESVLP